MDSSKPTDAAPSEREGHGGRLPPEPASRPLAAGPHALASSTKTVTVSPKTREVPEFADLLFACRHRPVRTVLVGGMLTALLVTAAWSLTKPLFEAEGLVRVREHQDVVFSAQTTRADDAAFINSQEKLALSPQVLRAALAREEVLPLAHLLPDHDRVDWLRGLMRMDMQSGSEVMSISAKHASPEMARVLANAVTQSYLDEVTNRLTQDRALRDQNLEKSARAADKRLDELWAELNSVAQSVGSDSSQSLTIRDELQYQAYRDFARQLQAAQLRGSDLERQRAEQALRMEQNLDNVDQVAETLLQQNPDIEAARERIKAVETQIQEMRQVAATNGSPRLARLFEDRDYYTKELDELIARLRPQLRDQALEKSRSDQQAALAHLEKQIELNRSEKELLRDRLSDIDIGNARVEDNSGGVQLDMSRHAIDRQTRLADSLWQSLQELRIESQSQPRVTLMELAALPQHADHSRQIKAAGAAGMIAWFVAILGIGYSEWRECRVHGSDDVTTRLAVPVFGSDESAGGSIFGLGRKRVLSGSREAAAQMMLHDQDGRTVPTVMVSSSDSGEPRHLVTLELAKAFAAFHRRTVIIDCDTAGSRLSRELGAQQLAGIRQVSPSESDARRFLVPTDHDAVDFLPVGQAYDNESWIDPRVLGSVIESLRRNYDAIVVNGTAIKSSGECLLLASRVDTILLSVFVGLSRWNDLTASEQSAAQAGITVGGCVLHGGKRGSKLRLAVDRQGESIHQASYDESETELHEQLEELQQDLRQVQSASSTSPQETPANQESSA